MPQYYSGNPTLGNLAVTQCKIYSMYQKGKTSRMTTERIRDLESIGFDWKRPTYKPTKFKEETVYADLFITKQDRGKEGEVL